MFPKRFLHCSFLLYPQAFFQSSKVMKMNNFKIKSIDSEKKFFIQVILIYSFFFSVLLMITNLKKTIKPNVSPSNLPLVKPDDSLHTSEPPKVDKKALNPTQNQATLTKFIEDNEKLINALGVFVAITVFVGELRLRAFGYVLSFVFMTLTVLLWIELWSKFPSERGDWKIILFENILSLGVLASFVYWLTDFRDIWHELLIFFIFSIISSLFSIVMKKFKIFNKLFHTQPNKLKWLRIVFGIIVLTIILSSSFLLAQLIAPTVNEIFDSINQSIKTLP